VNSKMSPERSTLRGPVLLADGSSCTGGCRIPVVEMSLVVQSIAAEHQCLGPAMANRAGVSSDCTWIGKDPEGHGQARCHNDDRACSDWSCARQRFYKSLKFFHGGQIFRRFLRNTRSDDKRNPSNGGATELGAFPAWSIPQALQAHHVLQ